MILVNGVPGRTVPCLGTYGVLPAGFPVVGDYPSPLSGDQPLLANRAFAQWLWVLTAPLPSSGTPQATDAGAYTDGGPANGTYSQGYRGLVMPFGSATPVVYTANMSIVVGSTAVTFPMGLAAESDLAFALAANIPVTFPMGLSVETDLAFAPATPFGPFEYGIAVESDLAFALSIEGEGVPANPQRTVYWQVFNGGDGYGQSSGFNGSC